MASGSQAQRLLYVFPAALDFPAQLGKDSLLTASLRNVAPCHVAFKIKTTATDRYRVRPNIGVVSPGETAHVKLVLVAQHAYGPELSNCKDRFLIQALPIVAGQQPDTHLFKLQKYRVQDTKLKVSVTLVQSVPRSPSNPAAAKLELVSSPLEAEIRASLLRTAAEQGIDGHRSSLTKFAELLLLHGAINTQQLAIALELVDLVFDQGDEDDDVMDINRDVHTWLEESEHSTESMPGKPSPKDSSLYGTPQQLSNGTRDRTINSSSFAFTSPHSGDGAQRSLDDVPVRELFPSPPLSPTTSGAVNPAVADGVDTYRQRALTVARMDSAEGAALDHARSGSSGGGGGGHPATITRGELAALALRKGKENDSREPAPLSLDGNGAGGEGERELFPTESINSEASVAHLVAGSDIMKEAAEMAATSGGMLGATPLSLSSRDHASGNKAAAEDGLTRADMMARLFPAGIGGGQAVGAAAVATRPAPFQPAPRLAGGVAGPTSPGALRISQGLGMGGSPHDSPAKQLAAMLRSTLRSPSADGAQATVGIPETLAGGAAMSDDDSDEYEEAHVFDYTPPSQSAGRGAPAVRAGGGSAIKPAAARGLAL